LIIRLEGTKLLEGNNFNIKLITPKPGTLNVFRGINISHLATRVMGKPQRIITVFSYFDRPRGGSFR
jgi:hypothetical protein